MKRSFFSGILVILALAIILSGCSGGTKASNKAVSVGKQAVSVADDYLDGKLTYDEADEKLDELSDEMDYVDDMKQGDKNKAADFSIQANIVRLSSGIFNDSISGTDETYDSVVDTRNSLADKVGEKKR